MFWHRDKLIRVEVVTPLTLSQPSARNDEQAKHPSAEIAPRRMNTDLTFKFAAFFAIVLQAVLVVWGYLELAAYYEQFGIRTSELELGTPTLLVYGYAYTFSELMSTVNHFPVIGPFIPGVTFIIIGAALTFLFFTMHEQRSLDQVVQRGMLVGVVLLLIFLAPSFAVQNGIDRGITDFEDATGSKASHGLSKEHTIITDQKEQLVGRLVVADTKSTFLQVNDLVYKVDNSTNRVVRQIRLKPKTDKSPPPPSLSK